MLLNIQYGYVVQYYTVLYDAMLYYAILYYAMLYYTILQYDTFPILCHPRVHYATSCHAILSYMDYFMSFFTPFVFLHLQLFSQIFTSYLFFLSFIYNFSLTASGERFGNLSSSSQGRSVPDYQNQGGSNSTIPTGAMKLSPHVFLLGI